MLLAILLVCILVGSTEGNRSNYTRVLTPENPVFLHPFRTSFKPNLSLNILSMKRLGEKTQESDSLNCIFEMVSENDIFSVSPLVLKAEHEGKREAPRFQIVIPKCELSESYRVLLPARTEFLYFVGINLQISIEVCIEEDDYTNEANSFYNTLNRDYYLLVISMAAVFLAIFLVICLYGEAKAMAIIILLPFQLGALFQFISSFTLILSGQETFWNLGKFMETLSFMAIISNFIMLGASQRASIFHIFLSFVLIIGISIQISFIISVSQRVLGTIYLLALICVLLRFVLPYVKMQQKADYLILSPFLIFCAFIIYQAYTWDPAARFFRHTVNNFIFAATYLIIMKAVGFCPVI